MAAVPFSEYFELGRLCRRNIVVNNNTVVCTIQGRESTYVIQYCCPALHGDALEHCEHGKPNVVEASNAIVGPLPTPFACGDATLASV